MTPPAAPGLHRCPGRCGRSLPARLVACTRCTARLPVPLRTLLGFLDRTSGDRRAEIITQVRDWLVEHPAPYDPDHAIAGQCEFCDEALVWLTTAKGARLPANADPDDERGNIVRVAKTAGVLGPHAAAAARRAGTRLWLHHAVTCPKAYLWNAKPRRKGPDRKAARP